MSLGGLHQALALDDALAVLLVLARAEVRLEHRRLGLLELQEQRIVVVAAEQQQDPGAGPDAADADDLAGRVDVAEPLEQLSAVAGQGRAVVADEVRSVSSSGLMLFGVEQLVDRDDQRRVVADPGLAVDGLGQLREGLETVLRTRLGDVLLCAPELLLGRDLRQPGEDLLDVDPRVPEVEVALGAGSRIASR